MKTKAHKRMNDIYWGPIFTFPLYLIILTYFVIISFIAYLFNYKTYHGTLKFYLGDVFKRIKN